MVVKFLEPAKGFPAIGYNMSKVEAGQAELLTAANFDLLGGMTSLCNADFVRHLVAVSALNSNISQPQLHVVISTKGQDDSKQALKQITEAWMAQMGYGAQPYLVFFHNDSPNNHVHIVSTRVDWNGRKINSGFERIRAVKVMNKLMGMDVKETWSKDLEKAKTYRCSTIAQFKLLLERQGYTLSGSSLIKFGRKLTEMDWDKVTLQKPDASRAAQLKAIVGKYAPRYDVDGLAAYLKTKMGIELVFHTKDGKPAYGYTVLDHAQKNAFKGSEIMPLKDLMSLSDTTVSTQPEHSGRMIGHRRSNPVSRESREIPTPFAVNMTKDMDDDQIHGPRRRRKRKARTNTR